MTIEKILEKIDGEFSQEEQAVISAELWEGIDPTKTNIEIFLEKLPETVRGEMQARFAQLED